MRKSPTLWGTGESALDLAQRFPHRLRLLLRGDDGEEAAALSGVGGPAPDLQVKRERLAGDEWVVPVDPGVEELRVFAAQLSLSVLLLNLHGDLGQVEIEFPTPGDGPAQPLVVLQKVLLQGFGLEGHRSVDPQ